MTNVISANLVCRSASKLGYSDAQNVIEGKVLGGVVVSPEHNASDIEHDIRILDDLAKKLRAQRFENGTLSLDSLRLQFKLGDTGLPVDCWQYQRVDANDLIEEVWTICLLVMLVLTLFMSLSSCSSVTSR